MTVTFRLPLGVELAKRLSFATKTEVSLLQQRRFHVHAPDQRVAETIEANFMPGAVRPAALVLTVRNWATGSPEDWIVYSVRGNYANTFSGLARLGSQTANWVWLLGVSSVAALILACAGIWTCVDFGKQIAAAVDDLSVMAVQIAGGNLFWRTKVRGKDQLGELAANLNDMAMALERAGKDQAEHLRLDGELQAARRVQEYLYPRREPELPNATVAGRTSPARMIGGDLYDFFELDDERTGLLCADFSGKGIPAALMMANLQAIARVSTLYAGEVACKCPAQFVEVLNKALSGRFEDNRYATLFWGVYNARTLDLTYVGAGHPAPILVHADCDIERLTSNGVPVGMFAATQYASAKVSMQPGSRLVVFTDGVTDAINPAGEEYGEERLLAGCRAMQTGADARTIAGRLMQAVVDWSGGTEQFDDTTVVVLQIEHVPVS